MRKNLRRINYLTIIKAVGKVLREPDKNSFEALISEVDSKRIVSTAGDWRADYAGWSPNIFVPVRGETG
jgi:hypothetical protein